MTLYDHERCIRMSASAIGCQHVHLIWFHSCSERRFHVEAPSRIAVP